MRFGKQAGDEIETFPIDRILMTERELWDIQQIAGVGCWEITRNGKSVQIQVSPSSDVRLEPHVPVEEK